MLVKVITLASCPLNSFTRPLTILPNQNTFRTNSRGGTVKMRTLTSVLKSAMSDLCCHMCLKNQRNRTILADSQDANRHTPLTVYMRADRHPYTEGSSQLSLKVTIFTWCYLCGCTTIAQKCAYTPLVTGNQHTM